MATGGASSQDERRIVLLGKIGAGKSDLANRLLGREIFKTEERGLCVQRQGENAGKKLIVVDTPGWDRVSVQRTPEQIKEKITQSPTLCLPGPHALLLVLPISANEPPLSSNEIKSASHHVELLSARAWRHSIALFVCQDEVDKSVIDQYVKGAKKLTNKCDGRYVILHRDSEVTALLQKIEDMLEDNNELFLTPSISYELYEKQQEELKQWCKTRMEEMQLEFQKIVDGLEQELNIYKKGPTRARSGSKDWLPPEMEDAMKDKAAVQHQDSQEMVELQTVRRGYHEEIMTILRYYMKPTGVILMVVIGALVGSLVGATDGVRGSCVGMIFGSMIGALLAIFYIRSTRLVRSGGGVDFSRLVIESGDQTRGRSGSHRSSKTSEKQKKQ